MIILHSVKYPLLAFLKKTQPGNILRTLFDVLYKNPFCPAAKVPRVFFFLTGKTALSVIYVISMQVYVVFDS